MRTTGIRRRGGATMLKRLSLAIALVLVCTAQSWAGTSGNGWTQTQTSKPRYVFCYAGNPNVVYFSRVIALAPKVTNTDLKSAYASYVQATYGIPSIDRERCVIVDSSAGAEKEKNRYKELLGRARPIDTQWAGKS